MGGSLGGWVAGWVGAEFCIVRVKLTTVLGFNLTLGYSRQYLQGRPLAAGTAVDVRQLVVCNIID